MRTIPPAGAETIELIDHTVYWSRDNWQTIFEIRPGADRSRKLPVSQANLVRFLAIAQASAGA